MNRGYRQAMQTGPLASGLKQLSQGSRAMLQADDLSFLTSDLAILGVPLCHIILNYVFTNIIIAYHSINAPAFLKIFLTATI
jgi:hypothetical protein